MTDDPDEIVVEIPPDPDVIVVEIPGEQGPAGRDGSGSGGGGREFVQSTPAATWTFVHGLGRRPVVSVFDASGAEMIADVFAGPSNVSIVFAQPTAGSAVLS